jgi:hypothetical protein
MRCEEVRERLMDLATADTPSAEPVVRQHLETCDGCRRERQRVAEVWALLNDVPCDEPVMGAMRQQFAGTLEAFRAMSEVDDRPRIRTSSAVRPALTRSRWAVAAAMLLSLVSGGLIGRQVAIINGDAGHDGQALAAVQQELRDVHEMLAMSLLQQASASERLRGVSAAGRLSDPRADVVGALLDALLHDPNVNVRLACVRAIERFQDRAAIREGVVTALMREQSPLVTAALISFVVDARDRTAIETLRQVSQDPSRDAAMRDTAAEGIERLISEGQL